MDHNHHEEMSRQFFYKYVQPFSKKTEIKPAKQKKVVSLIAQENPYEGKSNEEILNIKLSKDHILEKYLPKYVEQHWNKWWTDNDFFKANPQNVIQNKKKPFALCLPPPNVTGFLHIGHGLTTAVEDCIIRRKRMQGYETLYLPGQDHAGIATHTVVEKNLMKTENVTRHDLGREAFVKKVWEWKEKHGNQIFEQLNRLAGSLDNSRFHFTMDEQLSKAVQEAFIRFYDQGLIYRDNRLVNWSCKLSTAISDIELEYEDIDKPEKRQVPGHDGWYEFGVLIDFTYPLKDDPKNGLTVATTRLETMLGDVAVAVHSQDPRYKDFVGKQLKHPFLPDRKILVITDDELVDMAFGTGAVKITPAHDPNDYKCGVKHNLPIFNDDGTLNENCGPYKGMKRFDVRVKLQEDLKALGLLGKKTPNKMKLAFCSRSKDVVEPLLRPQWYVKTDTISKRMVEIVKNGELNIMPNEFKQTWYDWVENPRDWCISRQLWWGHRIPAFEVQIKGKETKQPTWIIAKDENEALKKACEKFEEKPENITLKQDEDVLDTWFSSGLFPFSTMGWPDVENPDFKAFFPNALLETGHDILFFWVARMVMMSLLLCDKIPFKDVFLHPIIRDSEGRKMSKSLGNVIDPIDLMDGCTLDYLVQKIKEGNLPQKELERAQKQKAKDFPEGFAECGSDSLRFGLLAYMYKTRYINLDVKRIIGYRLYGNKIWQTIKFALMYVPSGYNYDPKQIQFQTFDFINKWILSRINETIKTVNTHFDNYDFGDAIQADELCDNYLEAIKPIFWGQNQDLKDQTIATLIYTLDNGIRLLHPMMPFLTEELFHKLPDYTGKEISIVNAPYPEFRPDFDDKDLNDKFKLLNEVAGTIRQLSTNVHLPSSVKPDTYAIILNQDKSMTTILTELNSYAVTFGRAKSLKIVNNDSEIPKGCILSAANPQIKVYVNVKEHIKVDKEIQRLEKELAILQTRMDDYTGKLSKNINKMPQSVKVELESKIESTLLEQKILLEALDVMKGL